MRKLGMWSMTARNPAFGEARRSGWIRRANRPRDCAAVSMMLSAKLRVWSGVPGKAEVVVDL